MALRTTSSFASSRTAPCICPEKPTQEISSAATPGELSAFRTATPLARHQSRGSCSAQPGLGLANAACSSDPDAITFPCSSITSARVPLVPTSMPRNLMSPPAPTRSLVTPSRHSAHAHSSAACCPDRAPNVAARSGSLRLRPQEEIEIPPRHQMRRQRHLMRARSLRQELVQFPESHSPLRARTLVDRRHHRSRSNLRHQVGIKIGGNNRQPVQQLRIPRRLQYRDRRLRGHIDPCQIGTLPSNSLRHLS